MSLNPKKIKDGDFIPLRLNIVFLFFLILFGFISAKLFYIQVIEHDKYKAEALGQYWDSQQIPSRRGDIMSSDGYILAGTQMNYLMFVEPNNIENKYQVAHELSEKLAEIKISREENYDQLNEVIDEKETTLSEQKNVKKTKTEIAKELYDIYFEALNKDLMWVALERNLSPVEKDEIQKLNIFGIGFDEEPIRFYPENNIAASVLGFVASDSKGQKTGYFGIEGLLNEDLQGKPGRIIQERDALGTPILIGGYKKVNPIKGSTVYLSINKSIQYMVEKKLKDGVEKYDAISGTVIVMNPSTGEIIAMANFPTFSPEKFYEEPVPIKDSPHRNSVDRRNSAISVNYEPGSVIKPFTVAAAIDRKLVTPETTFEDNGPVTYSTHVIDNWDGKHHGTLNIIELLQKSNNIGAAWVGMKVGAKDLNSYLEKFGFGTKTEVSLEGEDSGILRNYEDWTDIDLANISFGQGMSATPLQILNGFNVFANGGFLLQPKMINKIIDNEKTIELPTKTIRKVISKDTAETMNMMLEKAAEGGEAKFFILKNYRIAGKTGTAQVPEGGTYAKDRYNATFVGYLSNNKEFSMIVRLEEPRPKIFASETAVPLWMELCSELVKFYGIPPDKEQL